MIPPCNAIVAWNAARCFCRAVLPLTVHSGRCRSATSLRDSGVARVAPATSRAPAAISGENVARERKAEVGERTQPPEHVLERFAVCEPVKHEPRPCDPVRLRRGGLLRPARHPR